MDKGTALYNTIRDAYLEAAAYCEVETDQDKLAEFRVKFGRNPAHIRQAVRRFPLLFNPDLSPDLFDILAALKLHVEKDDDIAADLYNNIYSKYRSYEMLCVVIRKRAADEKDARPAKPPKPAPTCERCERVKAMYDLALTGGYVADRPAATKSKILEALRAALNGEVTP